jgi:DNA polymerase-3 subunit gamma/tau
MQTDEYIALSRKYRPITFDEVSSHETVVTILKNQLKSKKLAHAYLFTGLHGTGKTTLARIFAKSLNCDNPNNQNPCNLCKSCISITNGSSLDVLEIDGASNRGIDDIRNINESIGYATFHGKYKIYIIDEVHMLTKEAFNALLKTLEEPPANTKFFLATTEAHKIPPTILSRCQRIDLKRISSLQIKEKLISISKNIGAKVDDDALSIIARLAEGSMRDAESLLENIIAYKKENLTCNDVYNILGIAPKDVFFTFDKAFRENDKSIPFTLAPKLFKSHTNLSSLIDELSTHFKHHAKALLDQKDEEISLFTKEEKDGYKKDSSPYSIDQALEILNILANAYHYNFPPISKQIHVEMLLQKILGCKFAKSAESILKHLMEIKNQMSNSGFTPTKQIAIDPLPTPKDPEIEKIAVENLPIETPKEQIHLDLEEKAKHDTILQFAAVELEAKLTHLTQK